MDQDALAKKLGYFILNAWALQDENEALKIKLAALVPAEPVKKD